MGLKLSAKQYLGQIQMLRINIDQNLERLEEMKSDLGDIGGANCDGERVQSTLIGNKTCNDVTRYIAFEESVQKEIEHFVNAENQIISEIRNLHNKNYVQVLYKVYVQGKAVKAAANEMNLSYAYVLSLHRDALAEFENTYKNLKFY